jgi:hypothetical protein
MRTLGRQLSLADFIRAVLSAFRGRIVYCRRTLGPSPSALADEEARADGAGVDFSRVLVDDGLLGLDDGAGLALVVDAQDFGAEFEGAALRGGGEGFEELEQALAVDDAAGVEFGDAGDRVRGLRRVEIDYFLRCLFECYLLPETVSQSSEAR